MTLRPTLRRASIAVAVGLTGALAIPGAASAASWHGISGTPYSGCPQVDLPTWYISNVARYKAGSGAVKVQFTEIGDNGLGFKIVNASNATIGQVQTFTKNETDITRTLATGVSDGRKFFNAFRETGSECNTNQHTFTGSEHY